MNQNKLHKTKNSITTSILFLLIILSGCERRQNIEIVEGVSFEIAKHRAATISNIRYKAFFSIPESLQEKITGEVAINFQLKDVSQPVTLDFNENPENVLSVKCQDKETDYEFINGHIVVPASSLSPGENTISIKFIAGESSLNRNEKYLYTLFVPDRASFAFPCFDQPNLKATYKLSLEIPESWQAVANGELINTRTANGRTSYEFAETKPLSTYLFSFAAGEFDVIAEERNGLTLRMFHRETDAEKVERNIKTIFDLHFSALEWLEEYTDIPYPFGKFDFVLIPSFQYGGMEHPGAILYRAASLFLEPSATQNQQLGRASLIAHETAHMWFGNLVTMDWFNDVWMKEVFANFMAAKIVNPNFPDINHPLRFFLAHHPRAYSVDRTRGTNPIRQDLDNLKNAGSLYGAIIYQKAPIVMRQLELLIGEQSFQVGLQEYLKKFSFANATWSDLIEMLDTKSSEDLKSWSKVWVSEPGRPHIKTELALSENNKISRLVLKQLDPQNKNRVWNQNINLVMGWGEKLELFPVQLNDVAAEIKQAAGRPKPDFVLANGSGSGYGYFETDDASRDFLLKHVYEIDDSLVRGIAWVTLWEEMLNSRMTPIEFINTAMTALNYETDAQNIPRILSYLETAFWKFHKSSDRERLAPEFEALLWQLMKKPPDSNVQANYFRTFRSIALSNDGISKLLEIWKKELTIPGLEIGENDMTTLALELAVRGIPQAQEVLDRQLDRIKSPDRKARFEFIRPALSPDQAVRDNFFERLKDVQNRSHEPWVLTALNYLHHPIRANASQKYLRPSLELVEEIQRTGDIFFPKRWLDLTFSGHNSVEAADIVKQFLNSREDYPKRLRAKILQSTDLLFRAASIVN
ncbi:hypothetical protein IIA28_17195 [candidate division KSB1 bacterium]|nr:hypothetical protein [candidate division KSB1 bacterium]